MEASGTGEPSWVILQGTDMVEDGFYFFEKRLILMQNGMGFEIAQGCFINDNIEGNKLNGPVSESNITRTR